MVNNLSERKKEELLSKEFKVACAILTFNRKDEKVWFTKLRDTLAKDGIGQSTVMNGLRTLFDWGIVKAEYGETEKGRPGRFLYVAGEARKTIEQVCDEYWVPNHK